MIMKNVIPQNCRATHIFDIKGSSSNRQVEKHPGNVKFSDLSPEKVYKDLDFNYYIGKLCLTNSQQLTQQLADDIDFLQKLSIIDYSILIVRIVSESKIAAPNVFQDRENTGVQYAFGIVDFLQDYNRMKQIEHGIKSKISKGRQSIIDVDSYGMRLVRTVLNIIA